MSQAGNENKPYFIGGCKYPLAKDAQTSPPVPTEFKVGDRVTFTNDYGVKFHDRVVTGFSPSVENGRFVYLDNDSWWFPLNPAQLSVIHG